MQSGRAVVRACTDPGNRGLDSGRPECCIEDHSKLGTNRNVCVTGEHLRSERTSGSLEPDAKHRPRYTHATDNQQVAKYLDLDIVYKKCRSFRPLADPVRKGTGNV